MKCPEVRSLPRARNGAKAPDLSTVGRWEKKVALKSWTLVKGSTQGKGSP